jgi:hypothetical protein
MEDICGIQPEVGGNKKELRRGVPFYGFPIGTISKVKKIVLGLRYKGEAFLTVCQIIRYVVRHTFSASWASGACVAFLVF